MSSPSPPERVAIMDDAERLGYVGELVNDIALHYGLDCSDGTRHDSLRWLLHEVIRLDGAGI